VVRGYRGGEAFDVTGAQRQRVTIKADNLGRPTEWTRDRRHHPPV